MRQHHTTPAAIVNAITLQTLGLSHNLRALWSRVVKPLKRTRCIGACDVAPADTGATAEC